MRISDWSSDVCSSDLAATRAELGEESDYRVRYIEKMATPFQRFFTGFTGSRLGGARLRHSEFARDLASAAVLADMRSEERRVGKELSVRVNHGCRRIIKKKITHSTHIHYYRCETQQ